MLASASVAADLKQEARDDESDDASAEDSERELIAYDAEVRAEISEEMSGDTEDWARSEESGWYYED